MNLFFDKIGVLDTRGVARVPRVDVWFENIWLFSRIKWIQ
jgi:hypothetical protein